MMEAEEQGVGSLKDNSISAKIGDVQTLSNNYWKLYSIKQKIYQDTIKCVDNFTIFFLILKCMFLYDTFPENVCGNKYKWPIT